MYQANDHRYEQMIYRRVGHSGLKLPAISLGLWHNFGDVDQLDNQQAILRTAFDRGVTHFDLANNYGPPPGSAEENFGRLFAKDFKPYRDEIIVSSKAGFTMWSGPYGDWGSRKYMIASCDQSLKRTGLDYFDIFYSHRPDDETNIEETAMALDSLVRQGKALYIGISNYSADQTKRIADVFEELKTPFIIHQPSYSMLNRWVEDGLISVLEKRHLGAIAYSPLAQGLLTDRYFQGVPENSRSARTGFLPEERVAQTMDQVKALNELAVKRGQALAQMALAWILRNEVFASVLVGASSVAQLETNLGALNNLNFTKEELKEIDLILKSEK